MYRDLSHSLVVLQQKGHLQNNQPADSYIEEHQSIGAYMNDTIRDRQQAAQALRHLVLPTHSFDEAASLPMTTKKTARALRSRSPSFLFSLILKPLARRFSPLRGGPRHTCTPSARWSSPQARGGRRAPAGCGAFEEPGNRQRPSSGNEQIATRMSFRCLLLSLLLLALQWLLATS